MKTLSSIIEVVMVVSLSIIFSGIFTLVTGGLLVTFISLPPDDIHKISWALIFIYFCVGLLYIPKRLRKEGELNRHGIMGRNLRHDEPIVIPVNSKAMKLFFEIMLAISILLFCGVIFSGVVWLSLLAFGIPLSGLSLVYLMLFSSLFLLILFVVLSIWKGHDFLSRILMIFK